MIFDIWEEIPILKKQLFKLFILFIISFALLGVIGG